MLQSLFEQTNNTVAQLSSKKRLAKRADGKLPAVKDIGFIANRDRIAAYQFGSEQRAASKGIFLVHRWMSGACYMLAMVDPTLSLGHEIICLDPPAHDGLAGKQTDLVECANADL